MDGRQRANASTHVRNDEDPCHQMTTWAGKCMTNSLKCQLQEATTSKASEAVKLHTLCVTVRN